MWRRLIDESSIRVGLMDRIGVSTDAADTFFTADRRARLRVDGEISRATSLSCVSERQLFVGALK